VGGEPHNIDRKAILDGKGGEGGGGGSMRGLGGKDGEKTRRGCQKNSPEKHKPKRTEKIEN